MSFLEVHNVKFGDKKLIKEEKDSDQDVKNLMQMGFSENRCKRALQEAGNNIENALNLILANVDNPTWDQPIVKSSTHPS